MSLLLLSSVRITALPVIVVFNSSELFHFFPLRIEGLLNGSIHDIEWNHWSIYYRDWFLWPLLLLTLLVVLSLGVLALVQELLGICVGHGNLDLLHLSLIDLLISVLSLARNHPS